MKRSSMSFSVKHILGLTFVVAVLALGYGTWYRPWRIAHTPIQWQAFSAATLQESVASGRPVIVNFRNPKAACNWGVRHESVFDDGSIRRLINGSDVLALEADVSSASVQRDLDTVGYITTGIAVYHPYSGKPSYILGYPDNTKVFDRICNAIMSPRVARPPGNTVTESGVPADSR